MDEVGNEMTYNMVVHKIRQVGINAFSRETTKDRSGLYQQDNV